MEFMQDDMIFKPYDDGFQCKMKVKTGVISVRYKGHGLITNENKPYEVWYPEDDAPMGYQTADDIWNYIRKISKCLVDGNQ